jgi:hypothetical protein
MEGERECRKRAFVCACEQDDGGGGDGGSGDGGSDVCVCVCVCERVCAWICVLRAHACLRVCRG